MKRFKAFLNGMYEYRRYWTTHYESYRLLEWYDRGREFAHIITFRRYDK